MLNSPQIVNSNSSQTGSKTKTNFSIANVVILFFVIVIGILSVVLILMLGIIGSALGEPITLYEFVNNWFLFILPVLAILSAILYKLGEKKVVFRFLFLCTMVGMAFSMLLFFVKIL